MTIPSSLNHIVKPVDSHLEEFDGFLRTQLKSNKALLDTVVRYILRQRGKRVRPTLVFLAAGLCGSITRRTYVGATMVELLHTATLVHDDVVDSSDERRGMASINAVWKNKIAVLVGDYLLSKGLLIAVNNGEYDYLKITSDAVRRMSEGELLQIQKSRQKTIDEETYFKIISDKTASLISTCCAVGAISATSDEGDRAALTDFGELVGLAFQIRDDVLDYTSRTKILGKPVGNDIRDQKITLPLLYACKNTDAASARGIVRLVKGKKPTNAVVQTVMEFVEAKGGIRDAQEKAQQLSNQAKMLLQGFPNSPYKEALIDFSNFVVDRTS